ncbi:MAG: hypothetical protein BMS9Abin28_2423 [Anaerolineae bacterium]|nr:MAG: hypothetical protein BMS9Abin28_2423 [Anaerolineae bacterium]
MYRAFDQAVINTLEVESREEATCEIGAAGGKVVHGSNAVPGVGTHASLRGRFRGRIRWVSDHSLPDHAAAEIWLKMVFTDGSRRTRILPIRNTLLTGRICRFTSLWVPTYSAALSGVEKKCP